MCFVYLFFFIWNMFQCWLYVIKNYIFEGEENILSKLNWSKGIFRSTSLANPSYILFNISWNRVCSVSYDIKKKCSHYQWCSSEVETFVFQQGSVIKPLSKSTDIYISYLYNTFLKHAINMTNMWKG